MKKVELIKGIESSVLGFGCAPIMGAVGGKKAKNAIECAIDNGVNHFDLGRSYGFGEAEKFVGQIIKPYRKNIIISSKFGIKPNFKAKVLVPFKPLVREMLELKKSIYNKKNALIVVNNSNNFKADRFHNRIELNVNEMKKSLEESLKALRTDYLDYFFIHEPLDSINNIDDLIFLSEKLKEEGKIRAFGLSFMQNQRHLHESYLDKFDILQFNNSPGLEAYEQVVEERANKSNIFFSPINGGQINITVDETLKKIHRDFSKSVILCSMFNERHIINNSKLFNE